MTVINNEEEVQKALGTLPTYRVCIFGPRGGYLIRWAIVEALTPACAICVAWTGCSYGVRKHFLKVFQNTYNQDDHRIHRYVSARVERIDTASYEQIKVHKFSNLCQIFTFDGKLRDDILDED